MCYIYQAVAMNSSITSTEVLYVRTRKDSTHSDNTTTIADHNK